MVNLLPSYEVWTWIKGYEGRFEISNRGRVRSWVQKGGVSKKTKGAIIYLSTPLIRVLHKTKFNYWQVRIGNMSLNDIRQVRVHREVAIAFVPNPHNNQEVNHVNGNKRCNEWWNFRWDTRIENIGHAFSTGLIKPAIGEAQSNTKLTNEIVKLIYENKGNKKVYELAKEYGVSKSTIVDIRNGRTWWHLTGHQRHIKPCERGKYKKQ